MRAARKEREIVFSFLAAITWVTFLHCLNDLIRLASCLGPDSARCIMETTYPALHFPDMVSKSEIETANEALRNAAVDRVSGEIEVDGDTIGNGMNSSSATTSSTEGHGRMERTRTNEAQRVREKCGRTRIKNANKRISGKRSVGSTGTITLMSFITTWKYFGFADVEYANFITV